MLTARAYSQQLSYVWCLPLAKKRLIWNEMPIMKTYYKWMVKSYLFPIAPPINGSCRSAASSFTNQGCILSCFWTFWHYWYLNISRSELNVQLPWSNKRRVIIVFNCNICSFASKFCSIVYLIRNKCKLSRSIVISGCIDWRKFSLATKPF